MTADVLALTGATAAGWEDAVVQAAGLLVKSGAATADYPAGCVQIVKDQGPYIVLAPGFALVHARPEAGALELGFAAVLLAEPVEFGHPTNDPVDLLISFCSPDKDQHLQAIKSLGKALAGGLAGRLRATTDSDELAAALKEAIA